MFRTQDYKKRLAGLYRKLAIGAAASEQWDKAMYWLQELINNYVSLRGFFET